MFTSQLPSRDELGNLEMEMGSGMAGSVLIIDIFRSHEVDAGLPGVLGGALGGN